MSENKQTETPAALPQVGEYKGAPTLTLNPSDRFPFTMGLAKAKQAVNHIDAIKRFVESNGKSC